MPSPLTPPEREKPGENPPDHGTALGVRPHRAGPPARAAACRLGRCHPRQGTGRHARGVRDAIRPASRHVPETASPKAYSIPLDRRNITISEMENFT